ncbi:MAG: hypothetical protein CSA62_01850 [Planctomycetota bacterium]|nr:MAG: hypothetical protein CSA62_01850 [Planctomycetota bacterium]
MAREARTRGLGTLALLVACVFLVGLLLGRGLGQEGLAEGGRLSSLERKFLETFARDFKLSPYQRQQLRIVLEEKERQKRRLMEEYLRSLPVAGRARFRQADRAADRRIYALLEPSQRELYRQRLADSRAQ